MQEFKALSYIRKYRTAIMILSLLLGALFYRFCAERQTYTASAIIQYKNTDAVNGLAADGTELDTSELYSSEVMTKVFQVLGLSYDEYNMDEIRAGVTVEPMLSEEEIVVQEALNAEGETASEKPTRYLVSYTVQKNAVSDAEKFATTLLKAMLDAYVETYAENHVNDAVALISVDGIYDGNYDYIEMVEILRDAVQTLSGQIEDRSGVSFRASSTGYTYADLSREYNLLREIDIPNVNAYILNNRITKDQDVLLAKYENRIETAKIENDVSDSEADGLRKIMDTYAKMIKESTNAYKTSQELMDTQGGGLATQEITSDVTYEYILDDIYDNYWREHTQSADDDEEGGIWHKGDQTTEYDSLISRYVWERTELEEKLVDIAYYAYIIDVYSGRVNEESGILVDVGEEAGIGSGEESIEETETEGETAGEETTGGETAEETPKKEAAGEETPEKEAAGKKAPEEAAGEKTPEKEAAGEETPEKASAEEMPEEEVREESGSTYREGEEKAEEFVAIKSSEEEKNTAYQMLKELTEKLDRLNRATVLTNQEYNRYAGAENIAVMTDVVTTPSLNLVLYSAIAFVLFVVIGCMLAIVGGRLAEMFEYYVYTDRKLELPNRAACDRYIGEYANKVLLSDDACIAIRMRGIEKQNRKYGRDKCDAMLSDFGVFLREIFPAGRAFTAVNALGQFVIFMKGTDKMEIHAYIRELMGKCRAYNEENECKMSYACGIAVSGDDQIYDIRKLMAYAVNISSSAIRAGSENDDQVISKKGDEGNE